MRRRVGLFALALSAAIVGGCSERPGRLPAPPVENMVQIYQNPYTARLKADSFMAAVVEYPTRDGTSHHQIPIGDYLAAQIVQRLPPGLSLDSIALQNFAARCNYVGFFGPNAVCTATMTVRFHSSESVRDVAARVDDLNVGPVMIASGDLIGAPSGGHLVIAEQAAFIARKLTEQVAEQLKSN